MKQTFTKSFLAACMAASMAVSMTPSTVADVCAADISAAVESGLTIRESEIHQLLTKDLTLPDTVSGLEKATVSYRADGADAKYVSVEGNTLKITRPYAGEGDYKFTLTATVTSAGGDTAEKKFPLTIREGLSEDSYAGYLYVCFADIQNPATAAHEWTDVQQVHFFLSEDGLNWTALNGCNPAFLTGKDHIDKIEKVAENSVNYKVAEGTDLAATATGDASVLFPFEGRDQGIRDPYLIRGCKKDGSDADKVWILATDLNTHSSHYNGDKANNTLGGDTWGLTANYQVGSQKLFIYETEDFVHWERRWIDVGSEVDSCMAWAPEAIYNPEKDNYLVYWSARTDADGSSRDRLYCNETKDFKTFGETKLYEQEPFYKNYGENGKSNNSGYGNIDTSQIWVAEKDKDGNVTNPYGTIFRVVKDETNNHNELQSAKSVLDPETPYDASEPNLIEPYELDGTTYAAKSDLSTLKDTNQIKRADIVYNWFKNNSVGNHFQKISQTGIESKIGAYEGATMFKFIDRDEWCMMIDAYGDMSIRYEPYVTADLSKPDSIVKLSSGYGRTGGDVGCHGGMIPITLGEYNTLIDTYNADDTVNNYHEIKHIPIDKRELAEKADALRKAAKSADYSAAVVAQMTSLADRADRLCADAAAGSAQVNRLIAQAQRLLKNKKVHVPELKADALELDEEELVLCTKKTEGLEMTAKLTAELNLETDTQAITFTSGNPSVAAVDQTGKVTAKKAGSTVITASTASGLKAQCSVTVKGVPNKLTLNKKSVSLKKGKTFQIKVKIPKGTVCSKFSYKPDKKKIVSVSKTGKVTAKKKGTAKITVKAGNSKAKAVLKVKVK